MRIAQAGITLVALVVTIVVLLILAGITITYVFSDNGILSQAQSAANKTDAATVLEKIQQRLLAIQAGNKGSYSNDDVQTVVAEVIGKEKDDIEIGVETVTTENGNEVDISSLWVEETSGGNSVVTISTEESYVGYYADVDNDGEVDGIIYCDYVGEVSHEVYFGGYCAYVTQQKSSRAYYISQESFEGPFGSAPVVSPADDTGNNRFYVMTITDFETEDYSTFYFWRCATSGELAGTYTTWDSDWSDGRAEYYCSGWANAWNSSLYASQNSRDIWGHVQDLFAQGWYIPTPGDWTIFAFAFSITEETYSSLGLSDIYWSSAVYESDIGDVIGPVFELRVYG